MNSNCLQDLLHSYRLADTHAHLDSNVYQGHIPVLLERASQAGLEEIWLMSISEESFMSNIDLMLEHQADPSGVKLRLGLGMDMEMLIPGGEHFQEELLHTEMSTFEARILSQLSSLYDLAITKGARVDIIGEVGIDHYWLDQADNSTGAAIKTQELVLKSKQLQESMFRCQIEFAAEKGIPLSIHSRGAEAKCIEIVTEYKSKHPNLIGVFHSFTGSLTQMREIVALGFCVGINGIITYKSANSLLEAVLELTENFSAFSESPGTIQEKLQVLYKSGLVLETDAPFLIPSNADRKKLKDTYSETVNEPGQVAKVLQFLSTHTS